MFKIDRKIHGCATYIEKSKTVNKILPMAAHYVLDERCLRTQLLSYRQYGLAAAFCGCWVLAQHTGVPHHHHHHRHHHLQVAAAEEEARL